MVRGTESGGKGACRSAGLLLHAAMIGLVVACGGGPVADPGESGEALCYDGLDNDDDGSVDCGDPGCVESLASCCVANPVEACCAPAATVLDLDFSACAGDPVACEPGLEAFGSPGPRIEAGGLVGGGITYDSGVWWPEPFDPSASKLVLDFEAASRAECPSGCLDAVGVGLTRFAPPGTRARPAVALIQSASRGELSLLVADSVMSSWRVDDSAFHRWRLALSPDGAVEVHELDPGGRVLRSMSPGIRFSAPARTWLVAYGRAPIPDPDMPASRVRRVTVDRGFCDMPQHVVREPVPVLPAEGAGWAPPRTTVPSVAIGRNEAGTERLAFELDGAIHLASQAADGSYEPVGPLSAPAFVAPSFAAGGISDPWLVADEDGDRWVLFFTAIDARGGRSVGRVLGGPGFSDAFDASTARIVATGGGGLAELSEPTVLGDLMVAKAVSAAGESSLVALRRGADGVTFELAGATASESRIRVPNPGDFAAFDRDEVGHPALVGLYRTTRLLFAGRRGTRWAIGLMVSEEGIRWRDPLGGEALLSGSSSGFDALGVIDSSALADEGGGLRVYFVGTDGAIRKVGRFQSGGQGAWPPP